MSDLNQAIALTLNLEGGWVDHPQDPGGKTMYGITEKIYRRAVRIGVIKDYGGVRYIRPEHARKIYEQMYWRVIAGDDLPRGLNALVFDIEVNSGRGGITLQNALNSVHASKIAVDGAIGPKTLAVVKYVCGDPRGLYGLLAEVGARRDWWWDRLSLNRTFGFGWNRRGSRVLVHAVRMACGDV